MATAAARRTLDAQPAPTATVEVVVPVHNEEHCLASSIHRLRGYLDASFPFDAVVTIADNASTDGTWVVAQGLASSLPGVRAVHLPLKGRGRALRSTWSTSTATVVAYMDVDLSTGLDALLPLVAPLVSGHSDVAIGTRLAPGARVLRGAKRELISRCYNAVVRMVLRNRFSDAQCGFKAMSAEAARSMLPLVADNEWFFDTELLVLAERNGLRIHEVPVDWVDDPDSRVDILGTAAADLRGIARLVTTLGRGGGKAQRGVDRYRGDPAELARFAGVGVVSTVVHVALFLATRTWLGPYAANAAALAVTAVANAAAHHRFTLRRRPAASSRRHLAAGVVSFATGLVLTSAGLGLAAVAVPGSTAAQVAALLAASALGAPVRFTVLRALSFHRCRRPLASPSDVARPATIGGPSATGSTR